MKAEIIIIKKEYRSQFYEMYSILQVIYSQVGSFILGKSKNGAKIKNPE